MRVLLFSPVSTVLTVLHVHVLSRAVDGSQQLTASLKNNFSLPIELLRVVVNDYTQQVTYI